ncbi:MAG: sulfite exporter TauE/SafE family protein [Deltaproteobacteria bacterium]|nr:sulfite exporter TauE/SafE family protein [Deltaproteobacteria bacterium]
MENFGYWEFLIVGLAVLGSAIIKNGVGIGAGIFMLPFLALVFPPKLALGIGAPAMLVSDVVGVRNYWKEWNREELLLLLPPAALGLVLGAIIIKVVPGGIFKLGVGVLAVLFSGYHLCRPILSKGGKGTPPVRSSDGPRKTLTLLFGFLGGTASTVIHAGGMVMSIYLIQRPIEKRAFVGTFIFFFAVLNLLKLLTYLKIGILTADTVLFVLILSPVIVLGGFLGHVLNKRFSQESFKRIVLSLILLIGVRLILHAFG